MNNYSKNSFACDFSCGLAAEMLPSAQTFALSSQVINSFKRRGWLFGGESPNDRPLTFSRLVVNVTPALSHTRTTARPKHRLNGRRMAGITREVRLSVVPSSLNESSGLRSPEATLGLLSELPGIYATRPRLWTKAPKGESKQRRTGSIQRKHLKLVRRRSLSGQPSPNENVTTKGSSRSKHAGRLTEEMRLCDSPASGGTSNPNGSQLSSAPLPVTLPRLSNPLADDLHPHVMLPGWRASVAVLPLVGSRTRAANRGNDLGGGEFGKSLVEGHGRRVTVEKKCAMQKIELAGSVQCRQISCMTATSILPHIATETMNIKGITFNVLESFTPEQTEAAGRKNTARVMRENGIAREITASRGNGTRLYMITEFESGVVRGWGRSVA